MRAKLAGLSFVLVTLESPSHRGPGGCAGGRLRQFARLHRDQLRRLHHRQSARRHPRRLRRTSPIPRSPGPRAIMSISIVAATKVCQVGDRFSVVRPDKDPMDVPWFKWQHKLIKAMGQLYVDVGQLRVVNVQPTSFVAEVGFFAAGCSAAISCAPSSSAPVRHLRTLPPSIILRRSAASA